jgi:hypothetical protein
MRVQASLTDTRNASGESTHSWRRAMPRLNEYAAASVAFLAMAVLFFNPLFRGFTFADVAAHQSGLYPWLTLPSIFVDKYPQSDQAATYYPWQVFFGHSLRAGAFPFWNPDSFAGQPFFANGQSALLYPPKFLLALVLSADWVHDILVAVPVFLGALAMFALLKQYRCGFLGALFGGIAWGLSPQLMGLVLLEIMSPIALLLPVVVLCVYRASIRRSWRWAIAAGLALGVMFLGTSVLYALLVSLVCGAYAVALAIRPVLRALRSRAWRDAVAEVVWVAIFPAVTLGICAVQEIPTFVLSRQGSRNIIPYNQFHSIFAVPLRTFLHTFTPPPYPGTVPGPTLTLVWMTFVGLPTAVFALIGLTQRRPGAIFASLLAATTFAVVIGSPATWLVYYGIPGFGGFLGLGRMLYLWGFALALLGGIGLDACVRWAASPHMPRFLAARAPVTAITGLLQRHRRSLLVAMRVIAAIAILGLTVQLGRFDRKINPPFELRQPQTFYPRTPLIDAIDADRAHYTDGNRQRILSIRQPPTAQVGYYNPPFFTSQHMVFGWESMGGYESLLPDRTVMLGRVVGGIRPEVAINEKLHSAYIGDFPVDIVRFDLLPRIGVTTLVTAASIEKDARWNASRIAPIQLRQVYAGADGELFDVVGGAPRAALVHQAEVVRTPLEALQRFSDPAFPDDQRLILEQPTNAPTQGSAQPSPSERAVITDYQANQVAIDVTAAQPGWVVLKDMWGQGWHATVNGTASQVLRADFAFRAIAVPAGQSHIELHYFPREFGVGAAISTGTVVAIVAVLVADLFRRYRRRRHERV